MEMWDHPLEVGFKKNFETFPLAVLPSDGLSRRTLCGRVELSGCT